MIRLFFFFVCSYYSYNVFSYPQFIGHGYNACITCHYNPYGNGPLNDYGRALSATAISDRVLHHSDKSEEEIAANSGFMYMKEFNSWFRPSLDYRGLGLERNVDEESSTSEYIHMQADINTVFRLSGDNKYIASISYGYAPTPRAQEGEDVGNYRSREHYVGMRPGGQYSLYVGMLDKVYGIRVPDHIAFSRSITGLGQNDQTHGVLVHSLTEKFENGVHGFMGSLFQKEGLRQKGVSTKIEYNISKKSKPGISLLNSNSDFIENTLISLHGKFSFSKGASALVEMGKKIQRIKETEEKNESLFFFMQNHILLRRGTYFFITAEYFRPDIDEESDTARFGPGLQYFLVQGVELRMDAYNTKSFSPDAATKDSWDLAGQIHLWF